MICFKQIMQSVGRRFFDGQRGAPGGSSSAPKYPFVEVPTCSSFISADMREGRHAVSRPPHRCAVGGLVFRMSPYR